MEQRLKYLFRMIEGKTIKKMENRGVEEIPLVKNMMISQSFGMQESWQCSWRECKIIIDGKELPYMESLAECNNSEENPVGSKEIPGKTQKTSEKEKKEEEELKKEREFVTWPDSTFFILDIFEMQEDGKKVQSFEKKSEDNIANILSANGKYAIVSRRANRGSSWEEYLVRLESISNNRDNVAQGQSNVGSQLDVIGNIMRLKMEWDEKKRKEIIESIEEWGNSFKEKFKDKIKDMLDYINPAKVLNQNKILNWMLENLPTVAMFFGEDSNLRINILDLEHTDSMYFDQEAKWSIYERMNEVYRSKGIKRFSMIASTGFWILKYVTPRYQKIHDGNVIEDIYQKEDVENVLLKRCGLLNDAESVDKNAKEIMNNLIAFLEKESWVSLSREQIMRLYKYFIKDIANEMFQISSKQYTEAIRNNFLLSKISMGE